MGFTDRIRAGYQGFMSAFQNPGKPLNAGLPPASIPSRYDYPMSINMNTQPRVEKDLTYDDLRSFADNYDLLRIAIEKRKDQVESTDWIITATDKNDPIAAERARELTKQFKRPDGKLGFGRWIRELAEDSIVIDAPSIYMRRNMRGDIIATEIVDGATIKCNIDEFGRTPQPPSAAYQQILQGMPAVDLTTKELLYYPRNPRSNQIYGYSKVEQIVMTVRIAIKRQLYQLGYYTEGNIPEAFITCPSDWGLQQIIDFQKYWDALFEGNSGIRRKARFVPNGTTPTFYKENPLKDEYDEWLARIICYTLDLPPTALVKETNRATAETTQDVARSEGTAAFLNYLSEIMNIILQDYMGYEGVEFIFSAKDSAKPMEQANINKIYVDMGAKTPSEVRAELGYDPLTDEQQKEIEAYRESQKQQNPSIIPVPKIAKTVKKKSYGKELKPLKGDEKHLQNATNAFSNCIESFFNRVRPKLMRELSRGYENAMNSVGKIDDKTKRKIVDMALDELEFDDWAALFDDAADAIEDIAKAGGYEAVAQVGLQDRDDITHLVDERSTAWAKERAAELVGKKWDGDQLIDNPNPRWDITESTRDYLRGTVSNAVEEGWSPQRLINEITDDDTIWKDRAGVIARTELQLAHQNGNLIGWKASGVVKGKRSLCLHDADAKGSDPCWDNADAGVIGIDDSFPSGDDAPPFHPNCVCQLIPVLEDDMED